MLPKQRIVIFAIKSNGKGGGEKIVLLVRYHLNLWNMLKDAIANEKTGVKNLVTLSLKLD